MNFVYSFLFIYLFIYPHAAFVYSIHFPSLVLWHNSRCTIPLVQGLRCRQHRVNKARHFESLKLEKGRHI